jgi:hypothetical protein
MREYNSRREVRKEDIGWRRGEVRDDRRREREGDEERGRRMERGNKLIEMVRVNKERSRKEEGNRG